MLRGGLIDNACSKEKKLLKSMKFPKEYETKIDLKKVNWEVMKTWIASRITDLLGVEDEVLVGYVYEQLEHKTVSFPPFLWYSHKAPEFTPPHSNPSLSTIQPSLFNDAINLLSHFIGFRYQGVSLWGDKSSFISRF